MGVQAQRGGSGERRRVIVEAFITKRFHHKLVLDRVRLIIRQGEKVAVVGANGAGKTTLLKIVAGLLEPSEGFVKTECAVKIYVPELDFVPRMLRVRDWFSLHGCTLDRVSACLPDAVARAVRQLWGYRVSRLSKGQRRFIGVSGVLCAYASSADTLLLLDEPFTGLSSEYRGLLREALSHASVALLVSAHSVEEVAGLADKIYILEEGRLREWSPEKLKVKLVVEDVKGRRIVERLVESPPAFTSLIKSYLEVDGVARVCVEKMEEGR